MRLRMLDEKLIKFVRQHPELYDPADTLYGDNAHKTKIWKNMGKELGVDGRLCKQRWSNIRDNYRRAERRKATRSSQGKTSTKSYKYTNQLTFLAKLMDDIRTDIRSETPTTDPLTVEFEATDTFKQVMVPKSDQVENARSSTPEDTEKFSCGSWVNLDEQEVQKGERKRTNSEVQRISENLIDYFTSVERAEQDPIEIFMKYVTKTLKKLPLLAQAYARKEIFDIVQNYELQHIKKECNK